MATIQQAIFNISQTYIGTRSNTLAGGILQANITWGLQKAPAHLKSILPAGNLYGRGASDNKAPVLAWIHAVEAYQALKIVRECSQNHSIRYLYHIALYQN